MGTPVVDYYSHYDEQGRLDGHNLEFIRSTQIISRYLDHQPMWIADVGGGPGTYSFWLATLGHQVRLLDVTPRHIDQATAHMTQTGVKLAGADVGDARRLRWDDDSFDLVLEMGPLYHLQDRGDRLACLDEAHRILKPGQPVVCAVINRWVSMFDGFRLGHHSDPRFRQIVAHDIATGCHDNPDNHPDYFTTAYFHTPDEIRDELADTGFADITVMGVEGFAGWLDIGPILDDPVSTQYLWDCLAATETVPELLGMSNHLIAVGRKQA